MPPDQAPIDATVQVDGGGGEARSVRRGATAGCRPDTGSDTSPPSKPTSTRSPSVEGCCSTGLLPSPIRLERSNEPAVEAERARESASSSAQCSPTEVIVTAALGVAEAGVEGVPGCCPACSAPSRYTLCASASSRRARRPCDTLTTESLPRLRVGGDLRVEVGQVRHGHHPHLAGAAGDDDDVVAGEEDIRIPGRQRNACPDTCEVAGSTMSTLLSVRSTRSTLAPCLHDVELAAGARDDRVEREHLRCWRGRSPARRRWRPRPTRRSGPCAARCSRRTRSATVATRMAITEALVADTTSDLRAASQRANAFINRSQSRRIFRCSAVPVLPSRLTVTVMHTRSPDRGVDGERRDCWMLV